MIYWDELRYSIGEELVKQIGKQFEDALAENNIYFINFSWEASTEHEINSSHNRDIITVETKEEENRIQELFIELFLENIKTHPSIYQKILDEDTLYEFSSTGLIKQCPVCRNWEHEYQFSFDSEMNVYKCYIWSDCQ